MPSQRFRCCKTRRAPARLGRMLMPLLGAAAGVLSADPRSAAEIDWRPREALPEEIQQRIPPFCDGGYLSPGGVREPGTGESAGASRDGEAGPVVARGLEARYEMDTSLRLTGDVEIVQGSFSATGSSALYRTDTGQVDLEGPLRSRGEGFLLTGESARYHVDSGQLQISDATFLLHEFEWRGSADTLRRPSPELLNIEQGLLTTCPPDSDHWALVASDIRLDQGRGFGTARNVRLEVRDVPVFYWPYVSFPIDERRKSGFLYPALGSSTAGAGMFVATPYYLNLAPNYDATFTPQYIHRRGFLAELEGRYLSRYGSSVLQLGYIARDREYGEEHPGEGERWALDFVTRARFGQGWSAYGDYAAVSDEDYFTDLNQSLDLSRRTHLVRQGGVTYQSENQYLNAYLSGYQTLAERISLANRPYDQLPAALYDGRLELGYTELGLTGQYQWFDRDNRGLTGLSRATGQRTRLLPELAFPLRRIWGYVRPSVTLDYTRYELDDYTPGDGSFDRSVTVAEWDSGLYFDRRDTLFGLPYNQTLEPRLYYAWADAGDQSHIPDFDTGLKSFSFSELFRRNRFVGGDRVGDANRLTAAVTSRINDMDTGIERARLSMGQVYYYDERTVSLSGRGAATDSESAVAGELVLRPLGNLEIRSSGLWDARERNTQEGRSQLLFHTDDYRYLAMAGHTYSGRGLEQSDLGAVVPVTRKISLIGRWAYDLENAQTTGTLAGLEYSNCCWNLQLVNQSYRKDDGELDHRFLFQVRLKGLGGTGRATDRIGDAIYGFDERESQRFGLRTR